MAKAADELLPVEVAPCKDFVMSDQFRDWAVGEMRREVMGQVSMAGLDRMAMVRTKPDAADRDAAPPGQSHQSKNK